MKKTLGFGTLESRIYIIFTLMMFAAIFIMQLVFFRFTISTVRNSTLDNNHTLLRQLVVQVDSYITGMERISQAIVDDSQIQAFLTNSPEFESDSYDDIQKRLIHYIEARDDISNILVVGHNGAIITGDPEAIINPWTPISEKDWYKEALELNGQTRVSTSYVQNVLVGQYSWVVSLSREIISAESSRSLGVLLVDLKFNRIDELCRSLVIGRKGYDFIIDKKGNYVFHPTQQLVYSNIKSEPTESILSLLSQTDQKTYKDGERYFMVETSGLTGWNIVSVTHDSDIVTDWRSVQIIYALIGLLLFLIIGLATNRISSGITKPVRKLQEIMKTVETGEFHLVGAISGTNEIRELAHDYDIMVGRIMELVAANTKEQELKRKSDLKALQAQINPHFLYNTLDSIIWMGEMGQNREVVKMTSALSKLFRISISKGHEIITIRDEIAHVQSYLTIQEMRYQDKFNYLIDIDPELHDQPILKITLQPLVENAIYHGIKESDGQGFIRITGSIENEMIVLNVQDNGNGMNRNELDQLNLGMDISPENRSKLSSQGMGLRNVHQRIRLYFGEQYGLNCTSIPGEGTNISVKLPLSVKELMI
ncbi:MAG: sensor histidine kinase [Spirochaetaceae bacterium]|nr:sensor histidine kinase [Spirochaetaceae bacterium]